MEINWYLVRCFFTWLVLTLFAYVVEGQSLYTVDVVIATGTVSSPLLSAAVIAYTLVQPTVNITVLAIGDETSKQLIHANEADLAFVTGPRTADDVATYPDTDTFPLMSAGIAITYNLPELPGELLLQLRAQTVAQIFAGHVTNWNDTSIRLDNPDAAANQMLPNATIHVVYSSESSGENLVFTMAMESAYPAFNHSVKTGYVPSYPSYHQQTVVQDAGGPSYMVSITPHAIAFTTVELAQSINASVAVMINPLNRGILIATDTMAVAAIAAGISAIPGQYTDCSNTVATNAYPICGYVFVYYNQNQTRARCSDKLAALDFLNWFRTSSTVTTLSNTASVISPLSIAASNVPPILMFCDSGEVDVTASFTTLRVTGISSVSSFMSDVLAFYQTQDTIHDFVYIPSTSSDALDALESDRVTVAVVQSDQYSLQDPGRWQQIQNSGEYQVVPFGITFVAGTFRLPDDLLALEGGNFSNPIYGGAPPLSEQQQDAAGGISGVIIDQCIYALMLNGYVRRWDDPLILAYNPWMAERYAYAASINQTMNVNITLIISDDPANTALQIMAYGNLLVLPSLVEVLGMYNASQLPLMGDWSAQPFVWNVTALQTRIGGESLLVVPLEAQLKEAVASTSGSVSYYYSSSYDSPYDSQFRMSATLPPTLTGLNYSISGSSYADIPDALYCLLDQGGVSVNQYSLDLSSPNQNLNCWPYSSLIAAVVPSSFTGSEAQIQLVNATLNMLVWMINNTQLTLTANSVGMARLFGTFWQPDILAAMNTILCNGKTCLITLPVLWSLQPSITYVGYTIGALGCAACLGMLLCVLKYRRHPLFKSASAPMLILILLGLMGLYISAFILVSAPTTHLCGALPWTVDLSLQLVFVPLFLRMYRIYKIFNRKVLKMVRISDLKLSAWILVGMIVDVIVLGVWQAYSPMAPLVQHVYGPDGVSDTEYLQCTISNQGMPYLLVLGAEKAALLLFGSVMSFSTRKVTQTFNDSTTVAWAIYNTIIATSVVLPISTLLGDIGDNRIILLLLLLLWISTSTLLLVFGTKVWALAQAIQTRDMVSFTGDNETRSMTGHAFSFISIHSLNLDVVDVYLGALQKHITAVRRHKQDLKGGPDNATENTKVAPNRNRQWSSRASVSGQETRGSEARSPRSAAVAAAKAAAYEITVMQPPGVVQQTFQAAMQQLQAKTLQKTTISMSK